MLDSHCHLLDVKDLPMQNFCSDIQEAGIRRVFCNSTKPEQWPALRLLAQQHQSVVPFYGIHPWHISDHSLAEIDKITDFSSQRRSFYGEIGLDRACKTDFGLQKMLLIKQLELAAADNGFAAIHCVKAWGPLLEILEKFKGKFAFMVHGFNGSREVMERLVAMGGMVSFSPRVMNAQNSKITDVLKRTPLDNLLLETDFPYHKGQDDGSASTYCRVLTDLYSFVAQLRQIPLSELIARIDKNGSLCTY